MCLVEYKTVVFLSRFNLVLRAFSMAWGRSALVNEDDLGSLETLVCDSQLLGSAKRRLVRSRTKEIISWRRG